MYSPAAGDNLPIRKISCPSESFCIIHCRCLSMDCGESLSRYLEGTSSGFIASFTLMETSPMLTLDFPELLEQFRMDRNSQPGLPQFPFSVPDKTQGKKRNIKSTYVCRDKNRIFKITKISNTKENLIWKVPFKITKGKIKSSNT